MVSSQQHESAVSGERLSDFGGRWYSVGTSGRCHVPDCVCTSAGGAFGST